MLVFPLFSTLFNRITAHAALAMPEPAKDTAIDIAPKTQQYAQGRVSKIIAEINRATSRVRDRNKDHDAVLENDAPTPSPRPTEITRIVRRIHTVAVEWMFRVFVSSFSLVFYLLWGVSFSQP